MPGLVGRRLAYLVPVLIAVTLLTFLIAALLPGDFALAMLAEEATPEKVEALHHEMGLDQPLLFQYLHWLGGALTGDLGRSFRTGEPVLSAILQRLPVTLELMLWAQLIALGLGMPLGILCAVRAGGSFDRLATATAFGKLAVPAYMLAIVLIYVFSVRLKLLPATGYVPLNEDVAGNLRSFVLP